MFWVMQKTRDELDAKARHCAMVQLVWGRTMDVTSTTMRWEMRIILERKMYFDSVPKQL